MKKTVLLILALILIACTPQVTVTSEVTVTLTPPPTETPTPTSTPEPAFYAEAQEFLGEGFTVQPDGKVIDKSTNAEIEGFTIVPFNEQTMIPPHKKEVNWGWQRVYEFEGKTDFTVVGTEADIVITENNGLDMYAWKYENGEFTRQKIEFAAPNNGTVEIDGYSPQEVQYMIINNSSDNPSYRVNSFQALRKLSQFIPGRISNGVIYVTYEGMWEPEDYYIKSYGNNFIPVPNLDGTWGEIATTEFLVYCEFKERSKALVVWMDKNNKPIMVVLEGKYLDLPEFFNPYWKNHDIKDSFNP